MANKIILKNKGTASSAPTVHSSDPNNNNDLAKGELSVNYVDGKIYYAKAVSYTHPPSPRDMRRSRMPSSA